MLGHGNAMENAKPNVYTHTQILTVSSIYKVGIFVIDENLFSLLNKSSDNRIQTPDFSRHLKIIDFGKYFVLPA